MPRMELPLAPGSLLAQHLGHAFRLITVDGAEEWELRLRRDGSVRLLIPSAESLTEVRGRWRLLESEAAHYVIRVFAKQVSGPNTSLGARLWRDLNAPLCLRVTAEETIEERPCPPDSESEPATAAQSAPGVGDPPPADYPHLVLGPWLAYHFSFKSDLIYFERFMFFADGTALRERWTQVDQIDDEEKHDFVATRGRHRFVQPDELRFEPEAPGAEPATLKVRPNIWPVGDIHLELQRSGGVPSGLFRLEREAA
jgi:hypothetical protein